MPCQQLHTDRQASLRVADGHTDATDTSERCSYRVDVCQVHADGIIGLLAELPWRCGRHGCDDGINLLEGCEEIARDKCAYLLRLAIVRIVVARGERVSTQQDA